MRSIQAMKLDAVIIGGGGAGLWLLDEMVRAGLRVLLVERDTLGAGQTICSQGIIHGGIKYTLSGALNDSARAIRDMPGVWRACLSGTGAPDLSATTVLAERCHLWRTRSLSSMLGMVGARAGLRTEAVKVEKADRPAALANCPGDVFTVDEQVIDTAGFLRSLADAHTERCLRVHRNDGVRFTTDGRAFVSEVALVHPESDDRLRLKPSHVVLTAGGGNGALRQSAGLPADAMQRRALHMVMVRGELPELFGHCVDGAKTRATITSATDSAGRTVWHVGGQISEDGVGMSADELIIHARRELGAVLPDVSLGGAEWATYQIDRAEGRTKSGMRPGGPVMRVEGNVITAWPTKLALVPETARMVMRRIVRDEGGLGAGQESGSPRRLKPAAQGGHRLETGATRLKPAAREEVELAIPAGWPRPAVAEPPWECGTSWR